MIRYRKKKDPNSERSYQLLINSVPVEYANVYARLDDNGKTMYWDTSTRVPEAAQEIMRCGVSEFLPIECIDLIEVINIGLINSIYITPDYPEIRTVKLRHKEQEQETFTITFNSVPDLAEWNKPYSFRSYCAGISQAVSDLNNQDIRFELFDNYEESLRFAIGFPLTSLQQPISDEVKVHSSLLYQLHERVEGELIDHLSGVSVVSYFDFPEEVRVPCEQYLLYFVQFLRDLGVEATSELKHEAGRVLFTVTPKDEQEALDKIRAALDAYLHLPSNPVSEFSADYEVAIQRLMANIHHLKGQLALQQAVLQTKDATIQALQFTVFSQQRQLGGEVMIESLSSVATTAKGKDKEELLGGTVAITKYEGKGFEVNLPDLFRRLRRLFAGDNATPPDTKPS